MSRELIIFIAFLCLILAIIIFQQTQNEKLLRRIADEFSRRHYPDHVELSSEVFINIVEYFGLRYSDVSLHSRFWNDFGFKWHKSLVSDLASTISMTCDQELDPKLFEECDTIKDIIDVALEQTKKPNKPHHPTARSRSV